MQHRNFRRLRAAAVILLIVFVLSAISGCASENKTPDTPLLWEVKYGETTLYLFGSIHTATRNLYPLSDTIMDAYNSSDYLMLELDLSDNSEHPEYADYFTYSDGTQVSDIIGDELLHEIAATLKDNGKEISTYVLESYTPITLLALLQNLAMDKTELSGEYGIDTYFMNLAEEDNKPILGAETYEQQMNFLNIYTSETWQSQLRYYLDVAAYAKALEELFTNWRLGNEAAFEEGLKLLREKAETSDADRQNYDFMIIERNGRMTDSAETCLKDGKNVFMIVGIAHLVGEDGVVAQLRGRGYDVVLLSGTEA
ncbi:MAG: hypothetical protein EOM54_03285 [Clostridia bacterium]|nr:hypothetical protein [Clostridia bacterium]